MPDMGQYNSSPRLPARLPKLQKSCIPILMKIPVKIPTPPVMSAAQIAKRKAVAIANLKKVNEINKFAGEVRGRKRIAKTLEIYVKQYLNTDVSVRHFRKWADAKPGEALPWAWKVVYGDGSGQAAIGKGQVNVLIQILTGNVPRGTCQVDDAPQHVDIDTDSAVNTPPIICITPPKQDD